MIRIVISSFLMSIIWISGFGQGRNPFSQYRIEHWNTKNGLPSDLVLSIYQSKEGFIWLTSYSNIARFDGVNFTTFNSRTVPAMKTDVVESLLAETSDSTLWIPTPGSGLIAYKNDRFTPFLQEFFSLRLLATSSKDELILLSSSDKNPFILFDAKSKKVTRLTESALRDLYKTGNFQTPNSKDKSGNL
jgi:hypothetical protein